MKKTVVLLTLLLFLTACAPDPRKEAEAYRIRTEANSEADAAAQALQQQEDLHAAEMESQALEQQNREAAQATWQMVNRWMIVVFGAAACVTIAYSGWTISNTVKGFGEAFVTYATVRAEVAANLIALDRGTRQYPLLRQIHGSRFLLTNPNDNSVMVLDAAKEADRQKITAQAGVQMMGVQYMEAAKANSAQDMSMLTTPFVHVQDGNLNVGAVFAEAREMLTAGGQDE